MNSLREILATYGDVRSLVGRFLNERGDVEKLKQLSRLFRWDLGELQYPLGDPQTTVAGTVTYLDTRASSSSVNRSSGYDTNIEGF